MGVGVMACVSVSAWVAMAVAWWRPTKLASSLMLTPTITITIIPALQDDDIEVIEVEDGTQTATMELLQESPMPQQDSSTADSACFRSLFASESKRSERSQQLMEEVTRPILSDPNHNSI